jgi:hypothetical protein
MDALYGLSGRFFGLFVAVVFVLGPAIAWANRERISRIAGGRRPAAVIGAALGAATLLIAWPLGDHYFDSRYRDFEPELGMAEPYRWADSTRDESIALAGTSGLTISDMVLTEQSDGSVTIAPGADIGVAGGSELSGVLRDRTYQAYEVKQIGEAVEQLAAVDGGFDFAIDVTPSFGKVLTLSYPRRGRIAGTTGIVFESGKNLLGYTEDVDAGRQATIYTAIGAGDGADMLSGGGGDDTLDGGEDFDKDD